MCVPRVSMFQTACAECKHPVLPQLLSRLLPSPLTSSQHREEQRLARGHTALQQQPGSRTGLTALGYAATGRALGGVKA